MNIDSQSYGSTLEGATPGESTWDPGRGKTTYLLIYNIFTIYLYLHIYAQVGVGAGCGLCRLSRGCAELASVEQRVRLLAAGHLPGGQVCLQPLIYHTSHIAVSTILWWSFSNKTSDMIMFYCICLGCNNCVDLSQSLVSIVCILVIKLTIAKKHTVKMSGVLSEI